MILNNVSQFNTKRSAMPKFEASYTKNGLDNTLNVSVASGSVVVTDSTGNLNILTADTGLNSLSITHQVPRVGSLFFITGGGIGFISHAPYPGAVGYKFEYNIVDPLYFASDNVSQPEHPNKTFIVWANRYQIVYVLGENGEPTNTPHCVSPYIDASNFMGKELQLRCWPVDAYGNIIFEAVSSDHWIDTIL